MKEYLCQNIELYKRWDFVSVSVPLSEETLNQINNAVAACGIEAMT